MSDALNRFRAELEQIFTEHEAEAEAARRQHAERWLADHLDDTRTVDELLSEAEPEDDDECE